MNDSRMRRFQNVHFIGIGGAGMSGIAEVMINLGYQVSGSDLARTGTVERLERLGARICEGHSAENVDDAQVVVASSAVADDNPEVVAAGERRIPVVPRAEMLGELMRFREGIAVAGTHGKTTTTSLVAAVLAEGGLDPTFVIGGLLNALGSNARLGEGRFLVAEADESDGSFLLLQPAVAVVTNIDQDHLESFEGDFERLLQAFQEFLHHLPFYGLAVICRDDPHLEAMLPEIHRNVITYGLSEDADVRATGVRQEGYTMHFELWLPGSKEGAAMSLNLPGVHNVRNALAAVAVAHDLGLSMEAIRVGLGTFEGIGRRFNVHGELGVGDAHVTVMDDYAHHPTELEATLDAARGAWPDRRLVVLFQPHRYTRTHRLLDDFVRVLATVDVLLVTDVYPAGEEPIPGADGRAICRAVRARKRIDPIFAAHPREAIEVLPDVLNDGDVLLFLGAGDVGPVAADFVAGLREEAGT
ncbi:MAG: UDP-N-acetylmuramate--L-alanine ligase [Xanthomonadales bacterium]|nr:UDP-N-acetylmuramate--L-alanine ligase [Xanthomonadales bacterium]